MKVSAIDAYDPKLKRNSMVIGFPYYSHDLLVNVKYRTLDKRFWQSKGAEKMLYGLNDVLEITKSSSWRGSWISWRWRRPASPTW